MELLAVLTIIAVGATISVPAISGAQKRAANTTCLSRMRALGSGILLYATDQAGAMPRSFHSAGAYSVPHWPVTIAPYLGISAEAGTPEWEAAFQKYFRCPADKRTDSTIFSYALNVHYELDPDGDDYVGSPARWRTLGSISRPAKSILLAESRPIPYGDHLMCHQWSTVNAARNALDATRHGKTSNYLFADGHAESLPVEATFNPGAGINLWNPSLAK